MEEARTALSKQEQPTINPGIKPQPLTLLASVKDLEEPSKGEG